MRLHHSLLTVALILVNIATPVLAEEQPASYLNRDRVIQHRLQKLWKSGVRPSDVLGLGDNAVPHIVDGAGWRSRITLVNLENRRVNVLLGFFDDQGADLVLPLPRFGNVSSVEVSLGAFQAFVIETQGTADKLSQGWGILVTDGLFDAVAATTSFRQRIPGRPDFEAAVPMANLLSHRCAATFDNVNGTTGLALSNPYDVEAAVTVTIRNSLGAVAGSATFKLPAFGHRALVTKDVFPATAQAQGVLEIASNQPGMVAFGLQFLSGGAFTTLPAYSHPAWLSQTPGAQ